MQRSSPLRRKIAALGIAVAVPSLVAATATAPAALADPDDPTPPSTVTLERLPDEVPAVVEITVPNTRELDRLVATGVDLDHGVEQRPDGLEVQAVVTPNEVKALKKAGFAPGKTLHTEKDSSAALADRDATIASAKAANEAFADEATDPDVSDVKITRAQYFTSFGVPVLSVEARYATARPSRPH